MTTNYPPIRHAPLRIFFAPFPEISHVKLFHISSPSSQDPALPPPVKEMVVLSSAGLFLKLQNNLPIIYLPSHSTLYKVAYA